MKMIFLKKNDIFAIQCFFRTTITMCVQCPVLGFQGICGSDKKVKELPAKAALSSTFFRRRSK